ncbi:MAG TPA: helix-turn-helix domain-containing protein [Pyrinomonadaceae bacterium]|jgi:AraC-like DNA-binding protein
MPVKKYQEFIPHATLQDSVKRFWILEKEYDAEDSVEEVTPDACVELIFNFGSPYTKAGDSAVRELPDVCLVGLLSKPLKLQASGLVKIVAVRFYAWGALAFLKNAASRNTATQVDIDPMWRQLVQRVAANVRASEYQKAVEEIEDFLIGIRLNRLFDPQQVRAAAKLLYHSKGQFRVAELADYCNLSVRQLQRQFDNATGVSPKTLARTIRFEAIRDRLMFDPNANLTELAYEFGYTDQAHFIKDFKAFTDRTPGEFAAELGQFQKMLRDNKNVVFLQSLPAMPDYNVDESTNKGGRR